MKTPPNTSPPRAFSLVEVLISIGIIAVLAAMLVPAIGRWQQSAEGVGCSSNLRQMFLYLNNYADENNGLYPAASDRATGYSWWLTLQNFIGTPDQVAGVGKKTLFVCPSAARTYTQKKVRRTYGMNCEGVEDWRIPYRKLNYTRPSECLFITDTKCGPANDGDGYQYFRLNTAPRFSDVFEERHGGKGNALFLDGHIKQISAKDPNLETYIRNITPREGA